MTGNTDDAVLDRSKIPESVISASETVGGYLDVACAFFTEDGEENPVSCHCGWMVVGNYYGRAIFRLDDGDIERIKVAD